MKEGGGEIFPLPFLYWPLSLARRALSIIKTIAVYGMPNCQHLHGKGNTSFSCFVKSKIRRFQGFIGGAGRTSGPVTTCPAVRKRHPLVAL